MGGVKSPLGGLFMNKGVIWDLDGVLADTAELHFRCWVTALAEREIPLDRQTFDKVFAHPRPFLVRDVQTNEFGKITLNIGSK